MLMPWTHNDKEQVITCVSEKRGSLRIPLNAECADMNEPFKCLHCWRQCEFIVYNGKVVHMFFATRGKDADAEVQDAN